MMWSPRISGRYPVSCGDWWSLRARNHEVNGSPGLTVEEGKGRKSRPVNTLLWRDDDGSLVGVFYHYPRGLPFFKRAGEVEISIRPDKVKQGIGKMLLNEAINRWDIQAKKQRYNQGSAGLTEAWLREDRAKRFGTGGE